MDAGYQAIGMDHFALPSDELAVAQRESRLQRNFMGYTVMAGADMIGFGVSAIGDMRGALVQDEKKLVHYYRMLDQGQLPVARGYQRTADDEIRRDVIHTLMCNFVVDRKTIEVQAQHRVRRVPARLACQARSPSWPTACVRSTAAVCAPSASARSSSATWPCVSTHIWSPSWRRAPPFSREPCSGKHRGHREHRGKGWCSPDRPPSLSVLCVLCVLCVEKSLRRRFELAFCESRPARDYRILVHLDFGTQVF